MTLRSTQSTEKVWRRISIGKTSSFLLGSLWFRIVVYFLSYSDVFVSRNDSNKAQHQNKAEDWESISP